MATELNPIRSKDPGREWTPPPIKITLPNIPNTFHCSIIGTCFSSADLRKLLLKLNIAGAGTDSEHALHTKAVKLAGMREEGKFLHKALDRQHGTLIKQFKSARGTSELKALWRQAVARGQIPGAYWAILTHPDTDDDLIGDVFGELHMLSHLNGAVSRAELRRLSLLEHENAALTVKLERQQKHLNEAFRTRDEAARNLQAVLVDRVADRSGPDPSAAAERETLEQTLAGVRRRLSKEQGHHQQLQEKIEAQSRLISQLESTGAKLSTENEALRRELDAIESHLEQLVTADSDAASGKQNLSSLRLLYVGGRAHQIPKLRTAAEALGANFAHHDGGIEDSSNLLPDAVGRADIVLFPVDCVSHGAAITVKRLCAQSDKPYVPLRSASLACLLSALFVTPIGERMGNGLQANAFGGNPSVSYFTHEGRPQS